MDIYWEINIDKLEITFERNEGLIHRLAKTKVVDEIHKTDEATGTAFLLHRIQSRSKYPYLFAVFCEVEERNEQVGTLYCGFDNPNRNKIYFSLDNKVLYEWNVKWLTECLQRALQLDYYQVSKLDLALDCNRNLTRQLYRVVSHDCLVINGKPFKYNTILNGKWVRITDEDQPLQAFCTGPLVRITKNKTLYIQNQKKTIGVCGYDKGKEIEEASHKEYQRAYWKDGKVYRIEVSLHNANEINQTFKDCGHFDDLYNYTITRERVWNTINDDKVREIIYFHTLNRLLYFTPSAHREKEKITAVDFAIETLKSKAHPIRKGRKAHTAEPTTAEPTAQPSINPIPPCRPLPSQYRPPIYVPNQYRATPSRPQPSQYRPPMPMPNRYGASRFRA